MQKFSGYAYLLIDIANQYGDGGGKLPTSLDKMVFEERIRWATENLSDLEALADKAETRPLYLKAVMALRKAQAGIPTGHLVGFDAVCSGLQIMSVLTGCVNGATATGLVDPTVRADAYSSVTKAMNEVLGSNAVSISRGDAKRAVMTSGYGSKAVPKKLFGEDTPELSAFYQAMETVAPGAWDLLQDLLGSWKPHALSHEWKMPDGFDVVVRVMQTVEDVRIEVDELDHATFTYAYTENKGSKKGLSNVANVVHSCDAYVLRCIHRRCNYDLDVVKHAAGLIEMEMLRRMLGGKPEDELFDLSGKVGYYVEQYVRSGMPDVVVLPYLDNLNVCGLSQDHLKHLSRLVNQMLEYKPFEVVTIH